MDILMYAIFIVRNVDRLNGIGSCALADREQCLFKTKDVLHFAPEIAIRKLILAQNPKSYMTADLFAEGVDRKENIEALTSEDCGFDVVICLHVLEHVDDRAAIGELYRVLRPGGLLIAMFPIVEGWDTTFEDWTKSSPADRLLYFGQHDHVRFFGRDARVRLAAPGFMVDEFTAVEPDVSRYGLTRGEKIFLCRRPGLRQALSEEAQAGALDSLNLLRGLPTNGIDVSPVITEA
jgi:SAM-dependent methyltransferase